MSARWSCNGAAENGAKAHLQIRSMRLGWLLPTYVQYLGWECSFTMAVVLRQSSGAHVVPVMPTYIPTVRPSGIFSKGSSLMTSHPIGRSGAQI